MTKDADLDIMNCIKGLPEQDAAFYFRSDPDDGFYYYTGTIEQMGAALAGLMEQDEAVKDLVINAVNTYME